MRSINFAALLARVIQPNSLTFASLAKQFKESGKSLDVEFAPPTPGEYNVEDLEGYAVVGMRARITDIFRLDAYATRVYLDFEPFEDHNRQFEKSIYWSKDQAGKNILTDARTAGQYNAQDAISVPSSMPVAHFFKVLDAPTLQTEVKSNEVEKETKLSASARRPFRR